MRIYKATVAILIRACVVSGCVVVILASLVTIKDIIRRLIE